MVGAAPEGGEIYTWLLPQLICRAGKPENLDQMSSTRGPVGFEKICRKEKHGYERMINTMMNEHHGN